jgi:hypothetical protein
MDLDEDEESDEDAPRCVDTVIATSLLDGLIGCLLA